MAYDTLEPLLLGSFRSNLHTRDRHFGLGARAFHARIVRLSYVEGDVTIDRPEVQGWAKAPVNTPLQQGFGLSTGNNSFAEIQFENGGTIRLGERALVDLTGLELAADGGKIDQVNLRQGYATFHLLSSRFGESLRVETPYGTLAAQAGDQFRVDLDQGMERVEVFHGTVQVQSNLGAMSLEADSVLVMQPGTSEPTLVSQGITKDDWDQWVENREAHEELSPNGSYPNGYADEGAGVTYGWSDLEQYGNWLDVPGGGYGWTPYSAATGWAPYSMGQWCYYPGWGYTWIGAEPWGWLPFHYGNWEFVSGTGWVWFPGSMRTWSPGQVTWYEGSNWVGWTPKPRRRGGAVSCENACGGGVVSTSTFRRGGLLNSDAMLRINPIAGTRVREPGLNHSAAATLPGPILPAPAAQNRPFQVNSAGSPAAGVNAASSPGTRRAGAAASNAPIVYDPQQESYVNGYRVTRPQVQPAFPAAPGAARAPGSWTTSPGRVQPAPMGNREPIGRPQDGQGNAQPLPAGTLYARPGVIGPTNNSSTVRSTANGGQAGAIHAGGVTEGVHSSSTPSGGWHSAPSGGGGGGGHSAPSGGGGGGHH